MGVESPVTAFVYRAARPDGRLIRGRLHAPTAASAGTALAAQGLHPILLREAPVAGRRAAPRAELALAFRSIAALASGGVPLERALLASEPVLRGPLREVIGSARRELHEGRSLADGLAGGQGVVPAIVVGMIRAGERGGRLGDAIDEAAAHLEREAALIGQVRQALAYPLLLTIAGGASVLVIGTVVVPRFAALLADLGQALPMATRLLLGGSAFVDAHWLWLAAGAVVSAAAAGGVVRRPPVRLRLHALLLRLPVVGPVRHGLGSARLARALGGMLRAGMPLLPALDAAREAAGDDALGARVGRARDRVAGGEPLARALEKEGALTPMAVQLVAVGESSGRQAEMCNRAGDLAAGEAERALRTVVTLLEPALVVFFGGVVAFVAAALLQAVYSIRPGG
jgi:type II secretory pathway component PulF